MNHQAWTWRAEHVIPSTAESARVVEEELLDRMAAEKWSERDVFGVRMAMEEAIINAIRHGNGFDESKNVHIVWELTPDNLRLEVMDEGPGFVVEEVPICTEEENLDKPSGRGIMLMRAFMSYVGYQSEGKCVVLEKKRGPPDDDE